jgi:hypothetical protein
MAGTSWCVTFEDVADATAMKLKLETCVFWRKCSAASVEIVGVKIIFRFVAVIERQDIQKKCSQTFKAYGSFKTFSVAKTGHQPKLETLQKSGKQCWKTFPDISGNLWMACVLALGRFYKVWGFRGLGGPADGLGV